MCACACVRVCACVARACARKSGKKNDREIVEENAGYVQKERACFSGAPNMLRGSLKRLKRLKRGSGAEDGARHTVAQPRSSGAARNTMAGQKGNTGVV